MRKRRKTTTNNNYPMIHYVIDADNTPFGVDVHTHGLDAYNHLELECILPFPADEVQAGIFNPLIDRILNGECIKEGCRTDLLTENYRMYFIEVPDVWDKNKTILRIIYPDENNIMPWEKDCNPDYAKQIFDIPIEKIYEVICKN